MGAIVRNGEIYGSNMAINDAQTSENTTWSSEKIDNTINSVINDKILSNGGNPIKFRIFIRSVTFNDGNATVSGLPGVTSIAGAFAQPSEGNYVSIIKVSSFGTDINLRALVLNTSPASPYSGTMGVNLYVLYV